MTLDEAIEYERKQYKSYKHDAQIMANMGAMESAIANIEAVAEKHEQLAEWLEELKSYRQYIDLTEIPEQYKLGFQDGLIAGNNKAIDDFADKIISLCDDGEFMNRFNEFTATTILEIAEQLKGCVDNA